jgi:hypothetical protein
MKTGTFVNGNVNMCEKKKEIYSILDFQDWKKMQKKNQV